MHFIKDTEGFSAALYFLRDKEKREVDFLVVIDNKPDLIIEVKTGDDTFSPSLFRFQKFLKDTKTIQLVHDLKRKKEHNKAIMLPVHEFLRELHLKTDSH